MKRNIRTLGALAAIAVAATTFVSQAQAAALVSLSFNPLTITNPGDAVGVDIVVTGLPAATGGFSLDLTYANLTFVDYSVGPGGTLGISPFDLSLGDLGGKVSFAVAADALITEQDLFAAQNSGGAFTVAHVDFTGVAAGPITLDLKNLAFSNFAGDAQDVQKNLLVCSGAACNQAEAVPEPMSALLVATALGALALRRKRHAPA